MSAAAQLSIPQDILDTARLTPEGVKLELAVHLYASGRLSAGKARELAELSLWEFRQVLASRQIPVHFDSEELAENVATLRDLGRL